MTQVEKYGYEIIKEAKLIEDVLREEGANEEITSNIIIQAVRKKRTKSNSKPKLIGIILKSVSALSMFVAGVLIDSSGYQNKMGKFIAFVIIFSIAAVSTVLSYVYDNEG